MPSIHTLSNGVRIVLDPMSETETVALNLWVNAGSRSELPELNGIAHFLEHMAFKGTQTRSAHDIAIAFDDVGGSVNAHTSREHTVYHARVLKDDWRMALSVISDILQHSVFAEEEVERERGVVLQEIAMTEDTPDDIIFDYFLETAYPSQALGRPILGPSSFIERCTRKDFKSYLDAHYSSHRFVLSVAGNIKPEEVLRAAEEEFASTKRFETPTIEAARYQGGAYCKARDLEQVHWLLGLKSMSYREDSIYGIQMLASILGGSMSSRLFQEIREKRGLAYSISASQYSFSDSGLFFFYAGTSPEKIEELTGVLCTEVKKIMQEPVGKEELQRAKNQVRASLLMGRERPGFRADESGRYLTCFDRLIPLEETLAKVDAVDADQVSRLMQQLVVEANPTLAVIGPIANVPSLERIQAQLAI